MTDQEYSETEQALLDTLRRLRPPTPAADIGERFRARTATHRKRDSTRLPSLIIGLAAVLLLSVTMLWSRDHARHQQETLRLQRQLTTALADLSAATRLQAINRATKAPAGDSIVAVALVNALLHDQNANVRVAAAEALAQLAPPRTIRLAAAQGLATESSPFVQVALLDVVRPLGSAERARVVRQLLARPDIDPIVRQAAARFSTL